MIIAIIGAALSILVPVFIYRYILRGQKTAGRRLYVKTFLLAATLYTLPIIVLELLWDAVLVPAAEAKTVTEQMAVAFLRAAALEEGVKYFFTNRVLKRNEALGMKEAILLAGLVGIGYGFTEKLAYASPVAMIVNGLLPGHMLFQWIMGYFLYKALRSEGAQRRKYRLCAFFVPFLVHGFWDFGLDAVDFVENGSLAVQILALVFTLAMIAVMCTAAIIGAKKLRRIEEPCE